MASKLLDVEDVADQLGLAVQMIYRKRSDGDPLPKAIRIGNRLRWRQEDVDDWIAERFRDAA